MDTNNNIQSIPSHRRICKYDVFISFRGPDTRNGFVDHLYNHLIRKGIFAFKDDERLEKGESISLQLVQAIKDSRISIVVFSRNYADSKWCLDEMAIIAGCKKDLGQKVFPIFYDVEPSYVRSHNGVYESAFDSHEAKFEEDKVDRWKIAMNELGKLAGWHIKNGKEFGMIEGIVQKVIDTLSHKFSGLADDLVGIQDRVERLEKLLKLSSEDDSSRVLGIWGMGGIGKTTHATVLYNRISYQFGACCFIENVSKIYKDKGAVEVQKQILRQTLDEKNLDTYSPTEISGIIRNRLHNFKVLVILDNVDDSEQFIELKIKPELLGAGSRMIITTRDEHILKVCGANEFYNVPLLSNNDARELFCRKAFNRFYPNNSCEELIPEVLKYAQCLPLAIEVLGSFLSHRDDTQWRDALYRLERNGDNKIMDVLHLSYEGLGSTEKEIFLHIACFFKGERADYVTRILDCCDLTPGIGIPLIVEKSLIIIRNDEIHMHEMLQELGRNIVQRQFPGNPRLWSRLWLYEDFHHVMTLRMGTNNVEAIVLNQNADHILKHIMLVAEEFSRMENLKLLILHHQNFSGNLDFLSNGLCYLMWHGYPFISLPPKFEPDRLVELNMPNSNLKRLSKEDIKLPSLKRMDLSNSKYLEKTPNFKMIQNLERLDLTGCTKLSLVDPSISYLHLLSFLSLQNCCSLVSLDLCTYKKISCLNVRNTGPPSRKLVSLRVLHLSGCTKLKNTPEFTGLSNLEYLDFERCTSLSNVDKSIGCLKKLKYLSFRGCTNLHKIPVDVNSLTSLDTLDLQGCLKLMDLPLQSMKVTPFSNLESLIVLDLGFCNLESLPEAIGELRCLERLNLEGNQFVKLPFGLENLSSLAYLNLSHCHKLHQLGPLKSPQATSSGGTYFKKVSGSRNHRSGLYIFDCPKLHGDPPYPASFWFHDLVKNPRHFRCGFDIVAPVTSTPEYLLRYPFKGGSTIRIVHFDVDDNHNWTGFAFFAFFKAGSLSKKLFKAGSSHSSSSPQPHPLFLSFETEQAEETFDMPLRLHPAKIDRSEHVWLIYISRPHCHFVKSGAHISFKAHPDLEIRNWGLRMISDATLQNTSAPDPLDFEDARESRDSSGSKIKLPYNWLVTDEDEIENMEAKGKENNLSHVGLTSSHHRYQEQTASSSRPVNATNTGLSGDFIRWIESLRLY